MKACSDLEHRGDPAVIADRSAGRRGDAGKQLEKRGLPGAVVPDNAEGFALPDFKGNVIQRKEAVVPAARGSSNFSVRIFLSAQACPDGLKIALQRPAADRPQTIFL